MSWAPSAAFAEWQPSMWVNREGYESEFVCALTALVPPLTNVMLQSPGVPSTQELLGDLSPDSRCRREYYGLRRELLRIEFAPEFNSQVPPSASFSVGPITCGPGVVEIDPPLPPHRPRSTEDDEHDSLRIWAGVYPVVGDVAIGVVIKNLSDRVRRVGVTLHLRLSWP